MRIARHGHRSNRGIDVKELKNASFRWDAESNAVIITARNVPGFSTAANYDYHLSLTLNDLESVLSAVGEDGIEKSPMAVRKVTKRFMRELVKLIANYHGISTD